MSLRYKCDIFDIQFSTKTFACQLKLPTYKHTTYSIKW